MFILILNLDEQSKTLKIDQNQNFKITMSIEKKELETSKIFSWNYEFTQLPQVVFASVSTYIMLHLLSGAPFNLVLK